jgi:glycosyltransferase involved in cell wall biosynthesis
MKVVHVSTYDTGGAATSALRLHAGLLEQEVDSFFLCLNKVSDKHPNKIKFEQPFIKPTLFEKIKNRIGFERKSQRSINESKLKKLNGEYDIFSFPITDYTVEEHPIFNEADIINLHWIADFVNLPAFLSVIKKPVVWTLHDMNPFLGGFHYHEDYERNRKEFGALEKEMLGEKKQAVAKVKTLAVVTPSIWLGESAKQSDVFRSASFRHISYGLDFTVFKLHDQSFARNVFNLPQDKKIILFVSETVTTYRKGFDLVLKALGASKLNHEIAMVTVGRVNKELQQLNDIYNFGTITEERLMSLLYAAVDLLILPSREDNLPNVMLEALACGTPVLSFKVGGMAEVIQPGVNGFFADKIASESLSHAIKDFCNGEYCFNRKVIRDLAEEKFSLEIQALKYISLYKHLLTPEFEDEIDYK